jgi:DNA polymerase-1
VDDARYDVLLIDTYSLFFRAYHALPVMNTQSGQPTHALYGLSVLLLKLLREHAPGGVAFAVDLPGGTFRHRAANTYKATRAAMPDALVSQLELLERLKAAFGFPSFAAADFEADDVLATLAAELTASRQRVLVVSGDRDLFQVVEERAHVLFLGQRGKPPVLYDEEKVRSRYQLTPRQLPSYMALVGDTSDNLPKVKGVGPTTAQELVEKFGSVAGMLDRADEVFPPRLRNALLAHAEQMRLSETLATLRRDVPLRAGPRYSAFDAEARARTTELFEELEFKSLIPRVAKLARNGP